MRVFVVVGAEYMVRSAHSSLDGAEKAVASMFKDIVNSQPELGKYGWEEFFEVVELEVEY